MRGGRLVASHASPIAIGSPDGQPEPPCMSLQTFGLMKVYWATVPWTAACPDVNAAWCAPQTALDLDGGPPAMSWKKTNGSCLAAYMPDELIGHAPVELLSPSMRPIQLMGGLAAIICVVRWAVFFVLLPLDGSPSP